MHRRAPLLPLAVAGLFAITLLAPGLGSPSRVAAATTPCHAGSEVTLYDLEILAGDSAGPVVSKYDTEPMVVSETGLACYGSRTLHLTAFVRDPGEVGWTYTYGLDPGWFRTAGSLFVAGTSTARPGEGPFMALAAPPALGDLQAMYQGHWVSITGHFDDPAAASCTATGEAGVAPSAADAVMICRSTFVVARVSRAEAPATSTTDAPVAPPSSWRAAWLAVSAAFGGLAALWFTGRRRRAWSISMNGRA
jgi:hypothetical protein